MGDSEAAAAIKEACEAVVADPQLKPLMDEHGNAIKTFCNIAVVRVCVAAGYVGFEGKLANDIYQHCVSAKEWSPVTASQAAIAAQQGVLTIAAQPGKPHGHVAVVFPQGGLVYSGKWQTDAPIIANVGAKNGLMGANWAFATQPAYFIWNKRVEYDEE